MKCPFCDSISDYSNIGNHWRQSCGYPEPDSEGVFDGLFMGDGTLKHNHNQSDRLGNQSIEVVSINKDFIEHLYEDYSPFFTKPSIRRSAEDSASQAVESDVVSSPEGSTFRTQYRIVSRAIPFFNRYDSWKTSNGKRWPDDIEFVPETLRYLYVADGGLSWNKDSTSVRAQITSSNEPKQMKRLRDMLNNMGIDCSTYTDRIMIKPSSTNEFLDYIGEPVPGFEYKWEINNLERYEELYRNVYYREGHTYTI
jgi:hypothetical protein